MHWLAHTNGGELWRRMVAACVRALRRSISAAPLLLQGTAAATAAWIIARYFIHYHDPFFAPLSAVIALNAPLGERGLNAMRLLLGVVVGIAVGELTIATMGGGYGTLALATFAAMAIAAALGGSRIMLAQAASGSILTVITANGEVGVNRIVDALIGDGVALVFSQFLLSPEPIASLRKTESAVLVEMADGLKLTAQALERDNDEFARRALSILRDLCDRLAELARLRRASRQVVRHSVVWWSMAPVVHEIENASYLDLLGGGCLMLARTVVATRSPERRLLATSVRELADVLSDLARNLGDLRVRQHAADRVFDVARRLAGAGGRAELTFTAAILATQMVAADIMIFAGVDPDQTLAAMREGAGDFRVTSPPRAPRWPFWANR